MKDEGWRHEILLEEYDDVLHRGKKLLRNF
jgi:hypothetical protein